MAMADNNGLRNLVLIISKRFINIYTRDVNLKIAFVIKGGKARKAEVSPQWRLHIYTSAFL